MSAKRWKRLMNPDYIGAYILEPNQELTLTIDKEVSEEITGQKGLRDIKAVAYFKENYKPMILNSTNCTAIEKLTGTDDPTLWAGRQITIYAEPTIYNKETVEALRVRSTAPKKTEAQIIGEKKQAVLNMVKGKEVEYIGAFIDQGIILKSFKDLDGNKELIENCYNAIREIKSIVEKAK